MAHCDSILRTLNDHPSRLNKEAIIEAEALSGNNELFEGMRLALDPMITFGVKKVPKHGGPDGQGLPWLAFRALADSLAKRELTGDAARDAIELCLKSAKQSEWNDWYLPILTKDLRCGVSEKTVNKVVEKNMHNTLFLFSVASSLMIVKIMNLKFRARNLSRLSWTALGLLLSCTLAVGWISLVATVKSW